MLFSIIIPFYNCEKHIRKSLTSAINQTLSNKHYEVIAINDLSKDRSLEIAKKIIHKENNCRLITVKKKTIGVGFARNYGLKSSKGKYIYFLDSDDFLKKNALYKLKKIIDKKKNVDLICNNYKVINRSKNRIKRYRFDLNLLKSDNKKELIKNFFDLSIVPQVISNLIKKKLIKKNKIIFKEGYFEDIYFIFKIFFYSKKKVILSEKIYCKNNRDNSIVNSLSPEHISDAFKGYISAYNFLKKRKKFYFYNFFLRAIAGETAVIIHRIKSYKITRNKKKYYYKVLYRSIKKYVPSAIENYQFISKKDLKFRDFIYNRNKYF